MVGKRSVLLLPWLRWSRRVAHTPAGLAAGWAVVDGYRWIGLDHGMPKQDAAAILGEILSEADALIRLRLKEQASNFRTWSSARLPTTRSWCEAMATMRSCARSVKT